MSVDTSFDFDYARTWAEHDPDPDTARQVMTWIEEDNTDELAAAFHDWADHPDAVFVVPHVELLARR